MKRLMLAAMIVALGLTTYSCAYKRAAQPSPGGCSCSRAVEKGQHDNER
jgi:hypothetical protein